MSEPARPRHRTVLAALRALDAGFLAPTECFFGGGTRIVLALDEASCCAEKFLANADRWSDESALGRDVIDLAFMASGWGKEPLRAGLATATEAYGKAVAADAKRAATRMLERADWRRRCVAALSLTDTRTLLAGLRLVAVGKW